MYQNEIAVKMAYSNTKFAISEKKEKLLLNGINSAKQKPIKSNNHGLALKHYKHNAFMNKKNKLSTKEAKIPKSLGWY
jgi:hypothetical protein